MPNKHEIKIIIRPTPEGFVIFIVEPDKELTLSEPLMSCYTLARGMIKFGLETPNLAFDYGMASFREEDYRKTNKGNGSVLLNEDIKKIDNILDITDLLKKRKKP